MKKGLKLSVLAAMFSAAFLFGISQVNAYTYSQSTVTVDQVAQDENEFILTNGANVTSTNILAPHKVKKEKTEHIIETPKTLTGYIVNLPTNISIHSNDGECEFYVALNEDDYKKWGVDGLNEMMNTKGLSGGFYSVDGYLVLRDLNEIKVINKKRWYSTNSLEISGVSRKTISYTVKETKYTDDLVDLGEASISILNKSVLTVKSNVKTNKSINVTGNSYLKASGTINGGDIYSDKAIISTTKDQGESIITPGNITATGALKSDTYIGAWSGAVSGKTVYSGGDIVSANSIKAGGLAKGNALNVAAINASSTSITGNQTICGVFTTTGQAKLNSGATLGGKKITGLAAGTLSTTSTEAVNGSQLNTVKEKLTTAGKSYTAGADIAISSANAISVSKTGTIKAGDMGIVTGATVYAETNSLSTKLNGLVDLVNSHQTKITSLQQQMGDLNQTITNINSQVASTTGNLTSQLSKCLKTDMGNLTDAGKTAIRNIVSSSLKSMGNQSSHALSSVNESSIATFEGLSGNNAKDIVSSKDVGDIHTSLASKVERSDLDSINASVSTNTKQIGNNGDSIRSNTASISSLKTEKADKSGSNIDVEKYADKLGTGTVAKDNTGLVSGDSVYSTLDKKADIGYMDAGMGMVESQMQAVQQQVTRDVNRVGAGASALAGLHPSSYDASDKLSFATGYGHYKNANTSALGAFYHPNEKTMVSLAGTIGNKDAMLSAGMSIKVGLGDKVSKVMVTPKMFSTQEAVNQEIRAHMDAQNERLQQIELAMETRTNG